MNKKEKTVDFSKVPRWMLVWGFLGFMSVGGWALKGAFADLDSTKERSLRTEQTVESLTEIVGEIKAKQTSFEAKYDRNQEENQRVFRQILAAVKS